MYPCGKSFLMCQWRQGIPQMTLTGCQAIAQHPQPQVRLIFSGGDQTVMRCALSPPPGEFPELKIWVLRVTPRRCMAPSPVSSLHEASRSFRAEKDACVWASLSPSPPFRQRRDEKRSLSHADLLIYPSASPGESSSHRHVHTAFRISTRQPVKRC